MHETKTAKPTILIVDDTTANLALLEEILHGQGYLTACFPNGRLALEAAATSPPDLILLDIMMPDMDGFEVCRRLKKEEALQGVPVLFISALGDSGNKARAFTQGGVDYITKPFQATEVLARVHTHLTLHWARQELLRHNRALEQLVQEKVREISDSQLATILALSKLAECRDDETGRHIERTRSLCRHLAGHLNHHGPYASTLSEGFVHNIYQAAPLHDIGKIGIPDHILLKPGPLTAEETETMRTHPLIGAKTLESVHASYPLNAFLQMGIEITRSHHERWDGSGYPDGLAGEAIPLSARIMAVADVYDALRSKRPYKESLPHEECVRIIKAGSGSHFDPFLVEAFLAIEPEIDRMQEEDTAQ